MIHENALLLNHFSPDMPLSRGFLEIRIFPHSYLHDQLSTRFGDKKFRKNFPWLGSLPFAICSAWLELLTACT